MVPGPGPGRGGPRSRFRWGVQGPGPNGGVPGPGPSGGDPVSDLGGVPGLRSGGTQSQ